MGDILNKAIDALWMQPWSIFVAWVIIILGSLGFVPEAPQVISWVEWCIWSVSVITGLTYTALVCKHNALPKGKDTISSVLFVIDAENDQFYNDVEKKLVSEFEECKVNGNGKNFAAICLKKDRIINYDINDTDSMLRLLSKVNCMFVVFVKHRVDSITNAENFEMQIDYGIMHPSLDQKHTKLLLTDMHKLALPIKKRRFVKAANIDEMTFTGVALSVICQYLIGLVMLLSGKYLEAHQRLNYLMRYIEQENPDYRVAGLDTLIKNRLIIACMGLIDDAFAAFYYDKNPSALEEFNNRIEELNQIMPETYRYYLNKAYYYVAKSSDIDSAKRCIAKCKQFKDHNSWKYSDAFISAYEGRAASTIYKKYMLALKHDQDLNQIGDFIEYILEKEPRRRGLHLAACLIYNSLNEKQRSSDHLNKYLSETKDVKVKQFLRDKKIWQPSNVA